MLSVYRSSAGSGKTYTLVKNYIDLLYSSKGKNRHRHQLAVTFTKKATAEMKERIIRELSLLASAQKSAYEDFLKEKYSLTNQQLQAEAQKILYDILQDYSSFAINTIDSFFQQIVRSFARELNLQGSYNVELDEKQIRLSAVDDFFFNLPKDVSSPITEQLLIIIEDKMEEGERWNPRDTIFGLTAELFKESYRSHQKEISKLLQQPQILNTYKQQLRQIRTDFFERFYALKKQKDKIVSIEQEEDFSQKQKRFSVFRWSKADVMKFLKAPKELAFLKDLAQKPESMGKTPLAKQQATLLQPVANELYNLLFSSKAQLLLNAETILTYLPYLQIVYQVEQYILKANKELNRLPISETNSLLHSVIALQGDTPFIYDKIGTRIRHYLIDEFQDTSAMQWSNFLPLILESEATNNRNMLVGDTKQSIYRWRNSDYSLLQNKLHKQFPQMDDRVLQENHRSSRVVVEQNNKIFTLLANRLQAEYESRVGGTDIPQTIREVYQTLQQNPVKQDKGLVRFEFLPIGSTSERRQKIMEKLPPLISDLTARGYALSDIAILVRKNQEGTLIANYLLQEGIQVMSNESMLVSASPYIKFLVLALQMQIHPTDKIMLFELRYQYALTKGHTPQEAFMLARHEEQKLLEDVMQFRSLDLFEQVEQLIRFFDFRKQENAQIYLQAFQDLIFDYVSKYNNDLLSFLNWWEDRGQTKKISMQQTDSIQILTIHASKGLEYKVVLIPFCDWESSDAETLTKKNILWVTPTEEPFSMGGNIPLVPVVYAAALSNTIFKKDYERELLNLYIDSLNLTYVAFTRAKNELYVFCPTSNYLTRSQKPVNDTKNIGSVLHSLLKAETEDDVYQVGERSTHESKHEEKPLKFQYPNKGSYSPKLYIHRQAQDFFVKDETNTHIKRVDLGIVMHEILCNIKHKGDENAAIDKALSSGLINTEQQKLIQVEMQRFWQLVADKHWFDKDYIVLNEQSIVLLDGTTRRPDRVMIRGKKAIVIDYKFGYLQPADHIEQVRQYMELIQEMGYQAEGYLCYINRKEIVKVEL